VQVEDRSRLGAGRLVRKRFIFATDMMKAAAMPLPDTSAHCNADPIVLEFEQVVVIATDRARRERERREGHRRAGTAADGPGSGLRRRVQHAEDRSRSKADPALGCIAGIDSGMEVPRPRRRRTLRNRP
jgi:hypothetical protein